MSAPTELLADLAQSLGADGVGWAAATVPSSAVDEYARWLDDGRHAGMAYLERQLPARADPSSRLEGVGSVLVLGISHAFEDPPKPTDGIRVGRVARYAWTPDYHDQLQPLLTRLETEAAALGIRARGYVDHGPVMERLFASGAFLGWRGKSGMTISTRLGAFITLAVLLTNLPFEGSQAAHPDRCGKCFRCVAACPTNAIGNDRAIDARRCISYLTIEHRGPVPHGFRADMGEWLFGCDVCSEVCPWSQKAGPLAELLRPQPELAHPDLSAFFGIGEREFNRRFAGTAFLRPRRKGMARNALTVLGNTRAPEGWPLLLAGMTDPAPEVREAAAWALGQWGEMDSVRTLVNDPDETVKAGAAQVLATPQLSSLHRPGSTILGQMSDT
ncbi:tRNA epoxyqueuosine(34) reductase QueG [Deinococcus sp. AJ005]|uniref:tRNA epoxyqueuosine(34) reductase QueG n=1 Tax=Deinococcus sp. AJ005 TaxID=2652443 RepID=UPI00125CB10C|nr:tRNA epoxyqueuosine(34) reductase QueG [Deinococcus sp. AJ005]QFP76309.1 tRNA epoxyqueuosine(34) reductase QueG [Deinococcus sp. AJ005]